MLEGPLDTVTGGRAGLQIHYSVQASAMEKLKKPLESFVNNNTDSKNRSLTSIIDQLLINRSRNSDPLDNSPTSTTEDCGQQISEFAESPSSNSATSCGSDSPPPAVATAVSAGGGRPAKKVEDPLGEAEEEGLPEREETRRRLPNRQGTKREIVGEEHLDREEGEELEEGGRNPSREDHPILRGGDQQAEEEEEEEEIGETSSSDRDVPAAEAHESFAQDIRTPRNAVAVEKKSQRRVRVGESVRSSFGRDRGADRPPGGRSERSSMPTDTLSASPAAPREPPLVKSERFSPEIDSSSSPSVSPRSPSPARSFPPASAATLGAFGLGLRTAPVATSTSVQGGLAAAAVPAFPRHSAAGLERFSAAGGIALNSATSPSTPAIKQMEMMTRNYSDFMRSLAAKYNNQNSQENNNSLSICATNGLSRLDSGYPFKTSSPRGLTGPRSSGDDLPSRSSKRENQTSPPLSGSQHHSPSPLEHHGALIASAAAHHRFSPYNLSDFSSSQTLLNLVRTASAQSASQLENYLRGAATGKRPLEGSENRGDPLDLSSKRCRTDYDPIAAALHGAGGPTGGPGLPFRDLRDLVHHHQSQGNFKLDPNELLSGPIADLNAALRLSAKRGGSLSNLLDNRLLTNNNSNNNNNGNANSKSSSQHEAQLAAAARTLSASVQGGLSSSAVTTGHLKVASLKNASASDKTNNCVSLCTEQSCTSKSDATEVSHWTVGDVVRFINTIECCSEYAEKFLEQSIDGASLCMLSEEHLTSFLGMKLGPALRLKAAIAKKIGHCATCMHCLHCHRDGLDPTALSSAHSSAHPRATSSPRPPSRGQHPRQSPRPQSSSPGQHSNKETTRSSPVSK